jgi:hypothetical protein
MQNGWFPPASLISRHLIIRRGSATNRSTPALSEIKMLFVLENFKTASTKLRIVDRLQAVRPKRFVP